MLQLDDPGWLNRRTDDLLPDHNHLMHLYVIRLPEMDRVWHLHPERGANDAFRQRCPQCRRPLRAVRRYRARQRNRRDGDGADRPAGDSRGPNSQATMREVRSLEVKANYNPVVSELPEGYRMIWEGGGRDDSCAAAVPVPLPAQDAGGQPPGDMELYMGMRATRPSCRTDGKRLRARASLGLGPDGGAGAGQVGAAGQSPRRST